MKTVGGGISVKAAPLYSLCFQKCRKETLQGRSTGPGGLWSQQIAWRIRIFFWINSVHPLHLQQMNIVCVCVYNTILLILIYRM